MEEQICYPMTTRHELANRKEYEAAYASMQWLTPETAASAAKARDSLVAAIFHFPGPQWACSNTKLFTHTLSPGCMRCGQGQWSCLFINGICNARCFYCPSPQDDPGPPVTNTLVFENAADYADYVNRFGIQGVSFSGGEPFLTFDRLLAFLEAVKTRVDRPVYTWIYTNGLLATREKLIALRDVGLDEIRFDLSADRYRLDSLEKALGVIPAVTVEIPAIPEDLPMTKQVIANLAKTGVNFLNLHQIRCTPYNRKKLSQRGYTFLHGPKVTVLESELAALELIRQSLERSIDLPINYCSHAYQHQFQAAGARRRSAGFIKAGCEDITPTGHIRRLTIAGSDKAIADVLKTLASHGVDASLYSHSSNTLSFAAGLWQMIDFSQVRLKVSYSQAVFRNAVSYHHPFKEIALNSWKRIVVEKQTVLPGTWLDGEAVQAFGGMLDLQGEGRADKTKVSRLNGSCTAVIPFETISPGLARYY